MKVVVLLSGGLDSAACVAFYQKLGYNVEGLFCDYTDKKTITVPWNYTVKLEKINRMVKEFGGPDAKIKMFSGYLDECWRDAMDHSDTQLKTAFRSAKSGK